MRKKYLVLGVFLIAIAGIVFFLVSSRKNTPASDASKLTVSTSFYPLYYFASVIGGDKAAVYNITPAGAEPHDYEPTPGDIARIQNSKLLILQGSGLEAWADSVEKNNDSRKTTIVVASVGTQAADPHTWLSPILAQKMADKILAGFSASDPENALYYQANETRLKTNLAELDVEYKRALANCSSKDIVTSHAAFGYLAEAYGLRQVSIAELSPDSEPSPKQLAAVADFVQKNGVKYIFFERLVSPKFSETIARETGTQPMVLDPIEGITPDDLAKGVDYMSVMRSNLQSLTLVLGCKA